MEAAIAIDKVKRVGEVAAEIAFALKRKDEASRLVDLLEAGKMPLRTTHNDTKINNVMLDDVTGRGICVIDLDTVMPGLSLYDFGDMVRTAVSPAAEDEVDLSKIEVRLEVFEALVKGFVEGAGSILTPAEWDNLVFAGKLMTFEVGIRFLTDYLEGDVYFRTARPGHNLDRSRTQFRLVESLEESSKPLEAIVEKYRAAYHMQRLAMEVIINKTSSAASELAAGQVARLIREKPNAVLGLATGSTPLLLYKELIALHRNEGLDFSRVITFNLDEYLGLSPSHHASYHRFMWENFFSLINVNPARTYVPSGLVTRRSGE